MKDAEVKKLLYQDSEAFKVDMRQDLPRLVRCSTISLLSFAR